MTGRTYKPVLLDGLGNASRLRERWNSGRFKELGEAIRQALTESKALPADVDELEAQWEDSKLSLADLRGLNLSDLDLSDVDLSYCCLDFASLIGVHLKRTRLQYTTAVGTAFDCSRWDRVQASPIAARHSTFIDAHVDRTYLMWSDLPDADFDAASIENTSMVGCNLRGARLATAQHLHSVDVTCATLEKTYALKAKHDSKALIGAPNWVEREVNVALVDTSLGKRERFTTILDTDALVKLSQSPVFKSNQSTLPKRSIGMASVIYLETAFGRIVKQVVKPKETVDHVQDFVHMDLGRLSPSLTPSAALRKQAFKKRKLTEILQAGVAMKRMVPVHAHDILNPLWDIENVVINPKLKRQRKPGFAKAAIEHAPRSKHKKRRSVLGGVRSGGFGHDK